MSYIFYSLSIFFIISGIIIAIYVAYDLYKRPQAMRIMNIVWVLTALWGSYLALWAYKKFGVSDNSTSCSMSDMDMKDMKMDNMDMKGMKMSSMDMPNMKMGGNKPHWQSVALSALHCGAGCTLADIIGESITYHYPITIASSQLVGSWVLDFILALSIGVFFQFYAIREMEKTSFIQGISRAFKADFFSLLSWQIGMYGWMCIVYFIIFKDYSLSKDSFPFWFMMQIAMLFGFIFAYPMNALLIKLGVKKGM